jgi:gliding motility-associated-like protein
MVLSLGVHAQLAHTADSALVTEYSSQDSILVYCGEIPVEASIVAFDSTEAGGFTFDWYQYNTTSKAFDIVLTNFTVASNGASSELSGIPVGGIRVVLTKGTETQVYTAWVFENSGPELSLQVIDPLDCLLLELQGTPTTTSFPYYDPSSGASLIFANEPDEYQWESDPEANIPNYNYNYTSTADLPIEDTQFTLTMDDESGCSVSASVDYTAIATEARWETAYFDDDTENYTTSETPEGSSPLKVRFTNRSVNGEEFFYFYGDTLMDNDEDSLRTTDFALSPEHTYYYTGDYKAWLHSISAAGCEDSIRVDVKVSPSKLELINSFSPNGDNYLDKFVIEDESIRYINIAIYTRAGVKVHEFEGDIANWDGWDGKNKGRFDASEGVYFYVIEAVGWDDIKYKEKGTLYLFR